MTATETRPTAPAPERRSGELTLREYLRSISGRKSYAVLSLRDPLPFFAALWGAIPLPFKRKEDA